jgi:hypothetical protein
MALSGFSDCWRVALLRAAMKFRTVRSICSPVRRPAHLLNSRDCDIEEIGIFFPSVFFLLKMFSAKFLGQDTLARNNLSPNSSSDVVAGSCCAQRIQNKRSI